jgi:ABC-type polysaccharide/polyol phosphate export permease
MFAVMFLSGSVFPLEMMPGFLQTFPGILPRYDVNEGLRASIVFVHNMTAMHSVALIGTSPPWSSPWAGCMCSRLWVT